MIKNERIKNFELKVQNISILIFDISHRKTDRKPNRQYMYSYIDVEVNPKRRIPSGTRYMDAYDVNDFKERLSKLFTKALKRGFPEQIIPEEIFAKFYPQLVDSESPSKSNEMSTISIYYRNLIIKLRKHFFYRASRYKRKDREDIKRFVRSHATLHEDNEIEHCRECGAIGDEIRTNRPPMIILNNDLNHPKYTCKRCGYYWGSTL